MIKHDVLVTTTSSSIEGYTIDKYIKIVSVNIVVGNNIFGDIAATCYFV